MGDLLAIGEAIKYKKILIGAVDHHTLQVERPDQVAHHRAARHGVGFLSQARTHPKSCATIAPLWSWVLLPGRTQW